MTVMCKEIVLLLLIIVIIIIITEKEDLIIHIQGIITITSKVLSSPVIMIMELPSSSRSSRNNGLSHSLSPNCQR